MHHQNPAPTESLHRRSIALADLCNINPKLIQGALRVGLVAIIAQVTRRRSLMLTLSTTWHLAPNLGIIR